MTIERRIECPNHGNFTIDKAEDDCGCTNRIYTESELWNFTDEQLNIAIDQIVERKMENLTLNQAWSMAKNALEEEWGHGNTSTMDVIEEYEFMTGNKIEEI